MLAPMLAQRPRVTGGLAAVFHTTYSWRAGERPAPWWRSDMCRCHLGDVDLWMTSSKRPEEIKKTHFIGSVKTVTGEMWRYQKPGFQALLLAELQRQQQGRQFCDTLLKTEGVSVPAHSCILSAISPHIASALSSAPPLLAGQSRLLEFRALRACTLLNVVRLVYSGEMAGEGGEEEKQQAISAAAELGIHGLVEVTKERDGEGRREEGRRTGMSAQTEAPVPGRNEGQEGRWTREVTNGSVFLWKETSSSGKKDTWTQTEELQVASAPPSHTAASFETIDMAAFQGLRPGDSHLALPQVPYVPLSLIYLPEENQIHPPPPQTFDPYSSHVATGPVDLQSLWADPQGAALDLDVTAAKEREVKWLEQFQGNIPGYISYYLNQEEEEEEDGFVGGRARRRRGAGQGGARRAGTGERRDRRPRAKAGGRGRFPQRVDVQEVGASRLHKVFLQRSRSSRAGQGGGAVGRKLDLKTRELLRLAKTRKGRGKVWEFSQSGDVLTNSECGGGGRRSRGGNTQQFNQDGLPVARARRARAKPAASVSFSSPSPSPAASTRPPSLCLPPLPLPPQEEQPEHLGRLLEEAMVGLDILPISHSAPHSRPPPPAVGGGNATRGNTLVQKKECRRAPRRGLRRSTRVAAKAGGGATSNGELPVLQQQGEGELSEVLENLLQTFEQHVNSCTARAAEEAGGESCQATPPKNTEEAPPKKRRRGKKNDYPFSLERKTPRKPAASSVAMAADAAAAARRDEQLRQMPVVKLERSGPLPDRVALPKRSCPEVKSRTKAKAGSPSVKYERHSLVMEPYPIRSRLAGAHVAEPCRISRGPPEAKPHCCPDNGNKEPRLGQAEDGSTREQTETPDVDGVPEDDRCRGGKAPTLSHLVKEAPSVSPCVRSAQEESVRPAGGWEEDEDIDVIGTSVPIPEPVLISWSSGGEEEDGDEDIEVV
ncbi:uncharacterized protein LOC120817437 isoform X3 [Gasterosteus aculeatus]